MMRNLDTWYSHFMAFLWENVALENRYENTALKKIHIEKCTRRTTLRSSPRKSVLGILLLPILKELYCP
jgi:hypothetical protein